MFVPKASLVELRNLERPINSENNEEGDVRVHELDARKNIASRSVDDALDKEVRPEHGVLLSSHCRPIQRVRMDTSYNGTTAGLLVTLLRASE